MKAQLGQLHLQVRVAASFAARARGLMLSAALAPGHGLLLQPCSAVHTLFVLNPLDVAFLDRDEYVVGWRWRLPPWRCAVCIDAAGVLELAAGSLEAAGVRLGERLIWHA